MRNTLLAACAIAASCVMTSTPTLAIGNGEYAVVARNASGGFEGEARLYESYTRSNPMSINCAGRTLYFAEYHQNKMRRWHNKGFKTRVEQKVNGRYQYRCDG